MGVQDCPATRVRASAGQGSDRSMTRTRTCQDGRERNGVFTLDNGNAYIPRQAARLESWRATL